MKTIAELFANPIDRSIEEVIKVDQSNENAVRTELAEYIATDSIKAQFAEVFKEIADGASRPREGIGMWISGFFGSGKSSFAKILGYTVANRRVGDTTAAALFKARVEDEKISALLDSITTRLSFEAVIFDVSMDRGIRVGNEKITEIIYQSLLRKLGYAEDFDLAELEITLEHDGKLPQFLETFQRIHEKPWSERRELGLAPNEAGAVLADMDSKTYPNADSWAQSNLGRTDITANKLAVRAFDLMDRRHPGKALIFIIDEVGQYVARSADKMFDLQGVIQAFGVEGRNRVEARRAVSPCWIAVTSQEKLDEVVTALDSKKIELAKLQDRFRITVDLKQSDITQVTSERVLKKKKDAAQRLFGDFNENADRIRGNATLERSSRNIPIDSENFSALYPYLPYQIDLCIDIVAGLRLKRGAHRHVGGSNRTIIKQAQQMMIHERTRLADRPVGDLVTLDLVYELLNMGNLLPTEVAREVDSVVSRFPDKQVAHKVIKAIALLEPVKDLPRTKQNLAVVLHPSIDATPLTKAVGEALDFLESAQFVRQTEDGYKLLTNQEKNWESQRSAHDPRPTDRNRIHRELIKEIFAEPKLRAYRFKELRGFRVALRVDGEVVDSDGEIPLNLALTSSAEQPNALSESRDASASQPQELFWLAAIDQDIRDQVAELHRSNEMVAEYDRLGAQNRLTTEEGACLADEKGRRERIRRKVRELLLKTIQGGNAFFKGVQYDVTALGSQLAPALHALLDKAVPDLYPKIEIGVLPLTGNEPDKFLSSTNLTGLPEVFSDSRPDRALIVKQSNRMVPNLGCDLCREILTFIRDKHAYGERVTGKMLENHFSGIGYAWDVEAVRLGLALLFRGGAVEVTHQGRKYRNYVEPAARPPFIKNPDFRAASFSPRETLDLKTLAAAARIFEEITGKDVNIEEGAIAEALKALASSDKIRLVPLEARLSALKLPGAAAVKEQLDWVEGILEMPADDCVKTLAGDGKAFMAGRQRASKLEKLATAANIETIHTGRRLLAEQWPVLEARQPDEAVSIAAQALAEQVSSDEALEQIESIRLASETLANAYRTIYVSKFEQRKSAYTAARDEIKGHPDWLAVSERLANQPDQLASLLAPLSQRADPELDLPPEASACRRTGATLGQIESDLDAVEAIARQVLRKVMEMAAPPEEKLDRIPVAKLYPGRISSESELDDFINSLRQRLAKSISQGASIVFE